MNRNTWIATVINNRADRVARSRAFAGIMVNDIAADRHFLIGSNLKGLQGMIWEAWDEFASKVSLQSSQTSWSAETAKNSILETARRFRVPDSDEQVRRQLEPMVRCVLPDAATMTFGRLLPNVQTPADCAQRLRSRGVQDSIAENLTRHHGQFVQEWEMR